MSGGRSRRVLALLGAGLLAAVAGCDGSHGAGKLVLEADPDFRPTVRVDLEPADGPLVVKDVAIAARPIEGLDCRSCHSAFDTFPHVHAAISESKGCFGCHRPLATEHPVPEQEEFGLVARGVAVCASCHEEQARPDGRHMALETGCTGCHDPHVSKQPKLLATETVGESCAICHEPERPAVPHAPVATGDCTGCHDPHRSEHASLLTADPRADLCLSCHEEVRGAVAFPDVHAPLRDQGCAACHAPHGGAEKGILNAAQPALCGSCHEDVHQRTLAEVKHPPVATCTECHDPHGRESNALQKITGEVTCTRCHEEQSADAHPGMTRHGAIADSGCASCHDPHGSDLPSLVRAEGADLCAKCHDPIVTAVNTAASVHSPAKGGACANCHEPHQSDLPALLRMPFPAVVKATEYRRNDSRLCFECHAPAMIEEPTAAPEMQFRDGDRNLHYVHVVQERRTCRSCHEAHAGPQPHLIRESLPYGSGGYEMKIEYVATESGGTCTKSCHVERSYRR